MPISSMPGQNAAPRILMTKLQLPPLRAGVLRPRLLEKLHAVLQHKLTLIAAPAGFGKTTLAARWLSGLANAKYAWLSLDENDNDMTRFLAYLVAAFQKMDSHIGRGLHEALHAPETPDTEAILTALLNDVMALNDESQTPYLIVLDDYHLLENPHIDAAIAFLLDYLPAQLHLLILSRIDPTLPLARLRAKNDLLEIRERDLRFTIKETGQFLQEVMGLSLSSDDIQPLHTRTEGWIAGLQLAGLALQARESEFVTAFSGTHRYILDYLTDEVFGRQPPEVQQFLLETSFLNRMCADLCDTLRQTNNSQAMLERLERANLFVVPLDTDRYWYRYHHLFADLLRQRLRQTMPEKVSDWQVMASRWYARAAETTGDEAALDEALYHANHASHHIGHIAVLLNQFGESIWQRGELEKLRRWLTKLPEDLLTWRFPHLGIFMAWMHATSGEYAAAEKLLSAIEASHKIDNSGTEHDSPLPQKPLEPELRGRMEVIRAFIATFTGQISQTLHHAQNAIGLLAHDSSWRSSAAIALGDGNTIMGWDNLAYEAYQDASQNAQLTGNVYLALNAGFKLAGILRLRGQLRQAYELCSQHIELAERSSLVQTTLAGALYGLRGDILCEWNQLVEALAQTEQAVATTTRPSRHIGFVGWIYLYRIRCLLAARRIEDAESALESIQKINSIHPLPFWLNSPLTALQVLLWLAKGNIVPVENWMQSNRESFLNGTIALGREFEYLIFVRMLILKKQFIEAESLLKELLKQAYVRRRTNMEINIYISQALLYQAKGQSEEAILSLESALIRAEPVGILRVFLDSGALLLPMFPKVKAHGNLADYIMRIMGLLTTPVTPPSPDALSERELEVLKLIASGYKNQQIADALIISLNTVLYHTKNIYGKLQVTHRTQAVQRAREMNLL